MSSDALVLPDDWPFLKPKGPLQPADASVALIVDECARYLVQLRDPTPTIYFPDHWGCFGGAREAGESAQACLQRELMEELQFDVSTLDVRYFTTFTFDFSFAGGGVIERAFFEVRIASKIVEQFSLGEGREIGLFTGPDLLRRRVVPYDRFAIWMHCYASDLTRAGPSGA